jgi:hypothetical protein
MKTSISSLAMAGFAKPARRRHLRLKIENQTSIKLNHEACTGRKWNTTVRGDGPAANPPLLQTNAS